MEIVQITDIDQLVQMRFDYFANDGHMVKGNHAEVEASLRDYFKRHIGHDFIALGIQEGKTIASVGYMVINEMPANGNAVNGLTGTLLNVLTYPEYRGRGYGLMLIEAIKKEARQRNLSFIDLYATEQGTPLYEKAGFVPISYRAMRLKL